MAIPLLGSSNTFQHWLIATNQLIAIANSLTDLSSTFNSNSTIRLLGPGTTLYVSNTAEIRNVSANTVYAKNVYTDYANVNNNLFVSGNVRILQDLVVQNFTILGTQSVNQTSFININTPGFVKIGDYLEVNRHINQYGANNTFYGQSLFANTGTSIEALGIIKTSKNLITEGNLIVTTPPAGFVVARNVVSLGINSDDITVKNAYAGNVNVTINLTSSNVNVTRNLTSSNANVTSSFTAFNANIRNSLTSNFFVSNTNGVFIEGINFNDAVIKSSFPSGTRLLFQQTNAPTGWTKITTMNDAALRVVSGAVTSNTTVTGTDNLSGFSKTPAGTVVGTVAGHALTIAQMPAHTHTYTYDQISGSSADSIQNWTDEDSKIYARRLTGTTDSSGSSQSHTHGWSGGFTGTAMNFAIKYVDVIIASKT